MPRNWLRLCTVRPSPALALAAGFLGHLPHAGAQPHTWIAGNGSWQTPPNWSPMGVPGGFSVDAIIPLPVTVTVDAQTSPRHLSITDQGATIVVNAARSLLVTSLTNDATILVNPAGTPAFAHLGFGSAAVAGGTAILAGSGVVRLGGPDAALVAPIDAWITQGPDHTLTGRGKSFAPLLNHGVIAPGNDGIARLHFVTDFTNSPSGRILVEIGGTTPGLYDTIHVGGDAVLDGTLGIALVGGYVPARGHSVQFLTSQSITTVTGRFAGVLRPPLPPGVALRLVYTPTAVDALFHCPPDLSAGAVPGQPGYGVPDGILTNDDFFFYLSLFASSHPDADLTTTAIASSPGYGIPNGVINNDDFFYYLAIFAAGC